MGKLSIDQHWSSKVHLWIGICLSCVSLGQVWSPLDQHRLISINLPLDRRNSCTRWVQGSGWPHPRMAHADWSAPPWVQVGGSKLVQVDLTFFVRFCIVWEACLKSPFVQWPLVRYIAALRRGTCIPFSRQSLYFHFHLCDEKDMIIYFQFSSPLKDPMPLERHCSFGSEPFFFRK